MYYNYKKIIYQELKPIQDELYSYLSSLNNSFVKNQNQRKFIILAHYRTGSTLLASLLNSHPQIFCDIEIFLKFLKSRFSKVCFPNFYIKGKADQNKNLIYGFDLKLYQLIKLNICFSKEDCKNFILNLYNQSWQIIYLNRKNLFRQEISSFVAQSRKAWFDKSDGKYVRKPIFINPQNLFESMIYSEKNIAMERFCLSNIPCLELVYEEDLLNHDKHQETMNTVFTYLGLESVDVYTNLKKTSSDNLADDIINYQEIVDFIDKTQYAHFLDS